MMCDVHLHKKSFASVVLSSGTNIVREIVALMTKELMVLAPFMLKLNDIFPIRCGLEDLSCPLTETSSMSFGRFRGAKCFPSQTSLETKASGVHDPFFRSKNETTLASAKSCTLMSCCQSALTCAERLVSA